MPKLKEATRKTTSGPALGSLISVLSGQAEQSLAMVYASAGERLRSITEAPNARSTRSLSTVIRVIIICYMCICCVSVIVYVCVTVSVYASVFASVSVSAAVSVYCCCTTPATTSTTTTVAIAATTAANIFLCQIMQSTHIDPRAPQAEKRRSERPA